MALPKLNNAPKFEMTIPSLNKKVRFRPFLVKEEKVLMIASEAGDSASTLNAIFDIVNACCVDESFQPNDLTAYDVEYMFLQIRAKSVGESSKINATCDSCNHQNEVTIDLNEAKVSGKEIKSDIIKLNDDISLKMKWPTYGELINAGVAPEQMSNIDTLFRLLSNCIDSVMTEEENFKLSDQAENEVTEFIESLSTEQFNKVKEYVEAIPQVRYNLKFTCNNCNTVNEREITGIANFF